MAAIVVYHSPTPLAARLAAAIHLGRLSGRAPRPPGAAALRAVGLEPANLLRPLPGLLAEGEAAGGSRVYSLGCGAAPWVVEHLCRDLAAVAGVPEQHFRLVPVVPRPGWRSLAAALLPGTLAAWLLPLALDGAWRAATAATLAISATAAAAVPATPRQQRGRPGRWPGSAPLPPAGAERAPLAPATVYHCFAGAHTSVTAANIHLGRLPRHRRPRLAEILAQPYFDWPRHRQIGHLIPMGRDSGGRMVYCVGLGGGKERLCRAMVEFAAAIGTPAGAWRTVSVLTCATWPMRVGGFLSCRLGLRRLGRPLTAFGAWWGYGRFQAAVRTVLDAGVTPTG